MTKTALLIIDVQEDFLPPHGSLGVADGRAIIDPIIELLGSRQWDAVVATKDWHPRDHVSFASNHGKDPFAEIMTDNPVDASRPQLKQVLWPDHCVQGTKGSEFPVELQSVWDKLVQDGIVPATVVLKGYLQDREYYSCFQDVWGIHQTECAGFLRDHGITDVVAVGIAYDYCVLNSCVDAVKCGFGTTVVKGLTRSVDPGQEDAITAEYESKGVRVVESVDQL